MQTVHFKVTKKVNFKHDMEILSYRQKNFYVELCEIIELAEKFKALKWNNTEKLKKYLSKTVCRSKTNLHFYVNLLYFFTIYSFFIKKKHS